MKKFRLDVDELRVESFEAALAGGPRAGVRAHEDTMEVCSRAKSVCQAQCTNYDGCSNEGTCVYSCGTGPCWCIPQG